MITSLGIIEKAVAALVDFAKKAGYSFIFLDALVSAQGSWLRNGIEWRLTKLL